MKRLAVLLPLPLALLLRLLASKHPDAVERVFSTGIYPAVAAPVSRLMSLCPFPIIEPLLVILFVFVIYSCFQKKPLRTAAILCAATALFIGFWGLNYLRLPLESTLGLTVEVAAPDALAALCDRLVDTANETHSPPSDDVFGGVNAAMNAAAADWPIPAGQYGAPKTALTGPLLSRLMIAGITSPFTLEALVNGGVPSVSLAYVACHEAAHVRGFAREEDANLVAYLACMASDDPYFRYSGTVGALLYAQGALRDANPLAYAENRARMSPEVAEDLAEYADYWARYKEAPAAQVGARLNDAYLQTAGVGDQSARSYGRVVDLLLALARENAVIQ